MLVQAYVLDTNVITEATTTEVNQAAEHRLTISLGDEPFQSEGALTSAIVIDEPTPSPRSFRPASSAFAVPPADMWTPQLPPDSTATIHECRPSEFELGIHELSTNVPLQSVSLPPTTSSRKSSQSSHEPASLADDPVATPRLANAFQAELRQRVHQNRMYGGFSSSSDSGESSSDERRPKPVRPYVALLNDETEQPNAG